MEGFFEQFKELIYQVKEKAMKQKLDQIYKGLHKCGTKMTAAAQFIDFFVHDILDFTILNKNQKNFTKHFTIFNIRAAIQ